MTYNQDDYEVVFNGPETYATLADDLTKLGAVSLGWTDNAMSHMDLLFVLTPKQVGPCNGYDSRQDKVFVAVGKIGCFAFSIDDGSPLHPDYVAEKLNMHPNPTSEGIADLLNHVRKDIRAGVMS